MVGGTEASPKLGIHCQHPKCNQLDFLPLKCDSCRKAFCLEHRSCKSHDYPKSDHYSRKVVVCKICSLSIETTGRDGEDEKVMLERHKKFGNCGPKKKKLMCLVRRCREVLTFLNTSTCKTCQVKVCLKHRFPADHAYKQSSSVIPAMAKFFIALASRNANASAKDCAKESHGGSTSRPRAPTIKAC